MSIRRETEIINPWYILKGCVKIEDIALSSPVGAGLGRIQRGEQALHRCDGLKVGACELLQRPFAARKSDDVKRIVATPALIS